jgi:hypothetical protein
MATINWSFADLFKGDEAEKETTTNMVMNALSASPEQRDVRVHDGSIIWKITMTPEGQKVMVAVQASNLEELCYPTPMPQCLPCGVDIGGCQPPGQTPCYDLPYPVPCPS